MKPLNRKTADKMHLPVKIVQFGEGNFLRAFVDWMVDKANKQGVMECGIAMVQPIRTNGEIASIFNLQDCLYHVVLEGIKEGKPIREVTCVQSVSQIVNPYTQYAEYEQLFLSSDLEMIVSNTTEAGIHYVEGDDLFASPPETFPAKMTALLYKRYLKFEGDHSKGLLVICCELIEDNGSTLREFILRHARHHQLEAGFIDWLQESCHFYDTLVDRIVPGFPKETIHEIKEELGFDDNLVVKAEYFHAWAIGGDRIIKEKLPLDKAGLKVMFMEDIRAFRARKVRILNGAHTGMLPVALLSGCETVLNAFETPIIEKFVKRLIAEEVLPMIPGDPEEINTFAAKILERFYNPYLKHYLKDIGLNSLSKWETRNFPTIADNYRLGRKPRLGLFSFAALLVLYAGCSKDCSFIPNDTPSHIDFIRNTFDSQNISDWVAGIIENKNIWRENLSQIPSLAEDTAFYVKCIINNGIENSLDSLLSE